MRSHLPLVRAIARRYAGRGEDLDDLVQAGSVGLVRASARFDPDRGVAFGTFVAPAVEGAIRRHLSERRRDVQVSLEAQDMIIDASSFASDAAVGGAHEPQSVAESEARLLLAGSLRALDGRERRIVFLRFHADLTERQIARAVGISQAHVSRLLDGALTKLRAELSSTDSASGRDTTESQAISRPKIPQIAGTRTKIAGVGAEQDSVGAQSGEVESVGTGRAPKTGYSGRFLVRMPSELHEELSLAAERRDISLNRYVTDALSTSVGMTGSAPADSPAGALDAADSSKGSGPSRPRTLRMALAANIAVVVVAGVVAVVLMVLALQRGI